jgi:hypothetical protein
VRLAIFVKAGRCRFEAKGRFCEVVQTSEKDWEFRKPCVTLSGGGDDAKPDRWDGRQEFHGSTASNHCKRAISAFGKS